MDIRVLLSFMLLTGIVYGCTRYHAVSSEGPKVTTQPQAIEQCQRQPELAWCHAKH